MIKMTDSIKCPICGKENERTYYSEEIGLCEEYYYCYNCGYQTEMCYSHTVYHIDITDDNWDLETIKKAWKGEKYNA